MSMSTFDEIIVGAKKCFDYAAEKVGDGIDASKVHIEKLQIRSEIEECYEKLGKLYYRSQTSGADLSAQCEKIIEKIGDLREKLAIADVKVPPKSKKCSCCDCKNPADAVFCSKCGENLKG